MTDETENLRELLRVSHELARSGRPFRCTTDGCPNIGAEGNGKTYGECNCFNGMLRAHYRAVERALS